MKAVSILLALTSALLLGAVPAGATVILEISAGSATVQITDNGPNDTNVTPGALTFAETIGIWNVSSGTGTGSSVLGSGLMNLDSLHISTTPSGVLAGSLSIMLTETGMTLGGGSAILSILSRIGGTTDGSVAWQLHVDDSDTPFGQAFVIDMNSFNSGGVQDSVFGTSFANLASITDTFSMTLSMVITHGDLERSTTFDFTGEAQQRQTVPEPTTLLLMGIGIAAFAIFGRRRQRR